jgi:hypothetical protein
MTIGALFAEPAGSERSEQPAKGSSIEPNVNNTEAALVAFMDLV